MRDPRLYCYSAGILSSCINFPVFSLVMASNNKSFCAVFGCHVTPSAQNQHYLYHKYFEIFEFVQAAF